MDVVVRYSIDGWLYREARSQDISTVGIFIFCSFPLKNGILLTLMFNLPNRGNEPPIEVQAQVANLRYRADRQVGLGLQFLNLEFDSYLQIENFVDRITCPDLKRVTSRISMNTQYDVNHDLENWDLDECIVENTVGDVVTASPPIDNRSRSHINLAVMGGIGIILFYILLRLFSPLVTFWYIYFFYR